MSPEAMVAGVTEAGVDTGTPGITGFTFSQAFGFFNVVVGLMIVAAFLLFFGGLTGHLTRLGLESRIEGLNVMYYGVTVLFVLVVLLGIVHFLQFNPTAIFTIIALLIIALIAWIAINALSEGGGDEKAKH